MFKIVCMNCGEFIFAEDKKVLRGKISRSGQVDVLFDADIYIYCDCGNSIDVDGSS